jgi:hypothetical protein
LTGARDFSIYGPPAPPGRAAFFFAPLWPKRRIARREAGGKALPAMRPPADSETDGQACLAVDYRTVPDFRKLKSNVK